MPLTHLSADPRPLAVARIGLGIVSLLNALEAYILLTQISAGALRLPVSEVVPAPTPLSLYLYLAVAVISAVALTAGYWTTSAASITTVLNIWIFLWDQQTYSNHRVLATLLVAYLIFARSDVAWAVLPRAGQIRRGPQILMMTQLSACYLFAGLSKINVLFISGGPLSLWVWLELPWWGFSAMALSTIVLELYLALALWLPAARRVAVVLGLLLHGSILLLMKEDTAALTAFGITCVSLYWLFLARPRLCPAQ